MNENAQHGSPDPGGKELSWEELQKTPPPNPYDTHRTTRHTPLTDNGLAAFADQYAPMATRITPFSVADAMLKRPAQVVHELIGGNLGRTALVLLVVLAVCMSAYGVVMGMFSGGHQLWAVPVKTLIGILLSGLICLPSLYIFSCLTGSDQTLPEIAGLFLLTLALTGILLLGFAPITWIFSQSTQAVAFMGFLHIAFWLIATYFGLRLLSLSFGFLRSGGPGFPKVWSVIFIMVVMQMCTLLRPLVGEYRGMALQEKKFFLAHWGECLD